MSFLRNKNYNQNCPNQQMDLRENEMSLKRARRSGDRSQDAHSRGQVHEEILRRLPHAKLYSSS